MRLIDDPAALEQVLHQCARSSVLAIDTEFERSVTYFPRPALIQLGTGDAIWLLDPLAIPTLEPLGALLAAQTPLKVMHGPMEDLEVLALATGNEPAPLFDTQLAAAFAGIGFGLGYHALVDTLLEVHVSKDQTRSNWLRRPLSNAQLRYAAHDVAHLPELYRLLHARLESLSRISWLEEESRIARARARDDGAVRDFLRLVGRVADDDRTRGALRALCAWRDREARSRDRPRRHLLDDPLLLAMAQAPPEDLRTLELLPAFRSHQGHAQTAELLAAAGAARDAAPAPIPDEAVDLSPYRATLGAMKRTVTRVARSLELDPALLAPRRLLEKAVAHALVSRGQGLPEEFTGWRAPLLHDPLMECLHDA
jgi:ribonuclease D